MFHITKKCLPYYIVLTIALIFGFLFSTSLLENIEFVMADRIVKLKNICRCIGISLLVYYLTMYIHNIVIPSKENDEIEETGLLMLFQILNIGIVLSDWLYILFMPGTSRQFQDLSYILDVFSILLTMTELNIELLIKEGEWDEDDSDEDDVDDHSDENDQDDNPF